MTPLLDCLGIDSRTRVIALVGAGGKTSLMYALAREMLRLGRRVVSTTTTKIYPPQPHESPLVLLSENDPFLTILPENLARFSHVTVAGRMDAMTGKLEGVTDDTIDTCADAAHWVLVEADGAAGRPVKAPAPWEPVIPSHTDLVIPVIGLDCLGKAAGHYCVFRLPEFLAVTGLKDGDEITAQVIAGLMSHPQGGIKGVREGMLVVPFLNKVDMVPDLLVEEAARAILAAAPGWIQRVAAGTLKKRVRVFCYSA
jgi:probable selenium-dependent hydroxylase accessory protein YqeC